jgi:hypothetical protein
MQQSAVHHHEYYESMKDMICVLASFLASCASVAFCSLGHPPLFMVHTRRLDRDEGFIGIHTAIAVFGNFIATFRDAGFGLLETIRYEKANG